MAVGQAPTMAKPARLAVFDPADVNLSEEQAAEKEAARAERKANPPAVNNGCEPCKAQFEVCDELKPICTRCAKTRRGQLLCHYVAPPELVGLELRPEQLQHAQANYIRELSIALVKTAIEAYGQDVVSVKPAVHLSMPTYGEQCATFMARPLGTKDEVLRFVQTEGPELLLMDKLMSGAVVPLGPPPKRRRNSSPGPGAYTNMLATWLAEQDDDDDYQGKDEEGDGVHIREEGKRMKR